MWDDGVVLGDTDNVWVLSFYSEGCSACKQFEPDFVKAAQKCTPKDYLKIKFGSINTNQQRYLTWSNDIAQVPSVKVFSRSKAEQKVFQGLKEIDIIMDYINAFCMQ